MTNSSRPLDPLIYFVFYYPLEQLVWRAARGTGAAPSFFRAMGPFLDGGLIANNPTLDVLTDIHKYNCSVRDVQGNSFGLVVSLGTGVPPPVHVPSFDVFKPESIWEATNVFMGARALGELLVDQVTMATVLAVYSLKRRTKSLIVNIDLAINQIIPTAFLVLPNSHLCFYNSIGTWYMFSFSWM